MIADLLQFVQSDPTAIAPLTPLATLWVWAGLSVLARLLGLLLLSPLFGTRGVPLSLRIGLGLSLTLIITPAIVFTGSVPLPADALTAAAHLASEFLVGALLGFGVMFVFAGLKLAGELIDQQAGAAVQEVFDPHSGGPSTTSGQLLTIVGTLALLTVAGGDGYLRIIATLLDSFRLVPADVVWSTAGVVRLIGDLGQTSLALGLQVAAPVLAAGAIVSWGLAQLGGAGGSPQSTTLLGLPVRVLLSLGILTLCLSGAADAVLTEINGMLDRFPVLLSGK
jgi:flagellar biosynthesis protein FliR